MLSGMSLLLAVTTVMQATPTPPTPPTPAPRAQRRAPLAPAVVAVPPTPFADVQASLEAAVAALEMARPDFAALSAQAPVFAMAAPELQAAGVALSVAPMALVGPSIALSMTPPAMLWMGGMDEDEEELTEPVWPDQSQADVADSVYRAARSALNQNQYSKSADLFRSIRQRYPRSTYVPNSYYWQAFALYRDGSEESLRTAREALKTQAKSYKRASTRRDADDLLVRVQGALARLGDEDAMRALNQNLDSMAPKRGAPGAPASCDDDDDDVRIAALNAVLQMDPDRAVPLLKTVLARRDPGSVCLRRKAVFLVSQKKTSETSAILLNAVRTDPDREVREQAVFWLSQVPGDETVAALDSVLRDPKTDQEIQEKALFALSQHHSARAGAVLRDFAMRRDVDEDLREKAVFWIGQSRSPENAQFLKDLFAKADNQDLKEKVLFSLSQMGGADNYRWLMDVALNAKEDIEIRKKALFWAGQGNSVDINDLVKLYDSMSDREMREQLIFVYSQRREEAAATKLCQIGKTDPDRELRKKAIFWLGQNRSAAAGQCLQELINQ